MADNSDEETLDSSQGINPDDPSNEILPVEETETITPIEQTENMEVHKHPHHVTHKKKWGEYLLEFFMLFLAVFLGFVAENIREHYVEHERVQDFARSLAADIGRDTANMTYISGEIKMQIKNTDSLLTYLKNRPLNEVRNIDLFALTVVDRYPAYRWSRSTMEEI